MSIKTSGIRNSSAGRDAPLRNGTLLSVRRSKENATLFSIVSSREDTRRHNFARYKARVFEDMAAKSRLTGIELLFELIVLHWLSSRKIVL